MADKEIKSLLKEAREHIKNKDYKSSLRECKKILNKDKNNYMALVFCGLSLSELDQHEQALQAYKRASDSNPDQAVAWEGLQKFYEKQNKPAYSDDYMIVLKKLTEFYQEDVGKHFDVSSKLAQLQLEKQDLNGSVETLKKQSELCVNDQEKHKDSLATIIKVLTAQPSLSDEHNEVLLEALEKLVSENQTPTNMENLKHLIKLQYKLTNICDLVLSSKKMIKIFPENIYPLEWICKVYLETTAGIWELENEEEVFNNIETIINALISFSPNNNLANLAQGVAFFKSGDFKECVKTLKNATNTTTPNFYGLYILCEAYKKLNDNTGVEIAASEALKFVAKIKNQEKRSAVSDSLRLDLVSCLYSQLNCDKMKRALEVINNLSSKLTGDLNLIYVKILANLGMHDKLETAMEDNDFSNSEQSLVKALALKSSGDIEQSMKIMKTILGDSPDNFEVSVLLAQMLYDRTDKEEAFGLFLKAAKLNPSHWIPFYYLGKLYEEQATETSLEKARKCFQKSVQMSGNSNVEVATALSDILRKLGHHQENLQLLSQVTSEAGARGGATWAWLRLGVHHLAVDQPGLAVVSLQAALRNEPENVVCWEALGDAYIARGSFVAARKAFEKVLTINNESPYSKLMIADINQKLGYHQDAINDYNNLLQSKPDYLPALRGLAETYLAQAEVFLQQFVDKNVVDCVQMSITSLTRAALLRPHLSSTWRLLGHACALVSKLSDTVVSVQVPKVLLSTEASAGDSDNCDRSSLLELGLRCYTKSLVLDTDNASTWHDLALVQFSLSQHEPALVSLRKAISLEPRNAQLWSSLGLVYTTLEQWSRAQHCFIKSLELDNTARCWTNLGVVYLNIGENNLANKAFRESQNTEPDYIKGWTGQALLAEIVGAKSECMDLFRHCTFLGPEPESARGYSDWVCSSLQTRENKEPLEPHNQYILDKMWGVSVGIDSLTAYTRRYPHDVTALCQLGVLCEKQGLNKSALAATENALAHVQDDGERDKILNNLGRIQIKLDRFEEAVTSYKSIGVPNLQSQLGLASAYYKLNKYQESYQAYDSCLHWLAQDDGLKSHILVAMGNLAYKVDGMAAAKTLLFQSCQLVPPSVRGLFALCVIGVQHSDINLIDAALSEMIPHQYDPRFAADIALLRASVMVLKGDVPAARKSLLSFTHKQPWLAKSWSTLSLFLLQNCPRDARAAAILSAKSRVMKQGQVDVDDMSNNMDSEVVATIALMMSGDTEKAVSRASQAVHLFPHLPEGWAILAAAAKMGQSPETSSTWLSRVLSHVTRLGSDNASLIEWAARVVATL